MSNKKPSSQPKIGYRSSHDDMADFLKSGSRMTPCRMDRHSHPGWYAALEDLSAKAGVSPPALYHVPTNSINGGMAFDALVLTDGLLALGGCSAKSSRPSKEVMMVMAHELGHKKQGLPNLLGARLIPFMMPMASMAALYIYDNTIKENKELSLENIGEAINKTTDNLLKQLHLRKPDPDTDKETHKVDTEWKASLLNAGRYLLAGVLGCGVGLAGARAASRHLEFDADRMAVKLTGDKQGYINFLKKLHQQGGAQFRAEIATKARPVEVTEKLQDSVSKAWKDLIAETMHAHPSMAEREAHLHRHFRDIITDSRAAAPPHLAV